MKRILFIIAAVASIAFANPTVAQNSAKSPKYYVADWESLKNYDVPEWYYDAKFGIWTHWGAYSVPAFRGTHAGEWYPRWMYLKESAEKPYSAYEMQGAATAAHHVETYGDPAEYGYHDFIPQFKAENWDPDQWAQLAIDCGAKFFTITGMHHDGFALYDSEHTEWNSMDMGPKRDLVGDLAVAVRNKGLKFGISNHFAHNRVYYDFYFKNGFDKAYADRPELQGLYSNGKLDQAYIKRWWDITTEMVDKYDPDLYYFDWCWDGSFWDNERIEFITYYYNHAIRSGMGSFGNPEVVLNYKGNSIKHGCAVNDLERAGMNTRQEHVWQTDTSISDYSWGYSTEDTFKSVKMLLCTLADLVSKNGVLMLNFGPKADGTVPTECYDALMGMGEWLNVNGEAIYATRPCLLNPEGPTSSVMFDNSGAKDIRYTQSKDGKSIYAISFGLPNGKLTLQSTKVVKTADDAKVTMLSNGMNIPFSIDKNQKLVLNLSKVNSKNANCKDLCAYKLEGFEIENVEMDTVEFSEIYIDDIDPVEPFSDKFTSQYPMLSAINALYERAHNGVKRDMNYHSHAGGVAIGDKKYDNGLLVCPVGDYGRGIFIIGTNKLPKIKGFKADIGIEEAVKGAGSCEFIIDVRVKGKWETLYKSDVITHADQATSIDVKIPSGAEYIRFVTTDAGDGATADHGLWADAQFY